MISLGIDINVHKAILIYTVQGNINRMASHRGVLHFHNFEELSLSLMSLVNYYPVDVIVADKQDIFIVNDLLSRAFNGRVWFNLRGITCSSAWQNEITVLARHLDIPILSNADMMALEGAKERWYVRINDL